MCSLAATFGDIYGYFKLANIQNDSTAESNENSHTPQLKQRNDVDSQKNSLRCNIGNCKNLKLIFLQQKDN